MNMTELTVTDRVAHWNTLKVLSCAKRMKSRAPATTRVAQETKFLSDCQTRFNKTFGEIE